MGEGEWTYSRVLEALAPDQATRRDYLAKHFEGRAPAETHEELAGLAADGLVRAFVTTNFDRLLERALQARGVESVVVTDEVSLDSAMPREHAACYVVKPHGDYLQQTIRNTAAELEHLPPAIEQELEQVFGRYGLLVLGYSGADPALGRALRERRSREDDLDEGLLEPFAHQGIDHRPGAGGALVADARRRFTLTARGLTPSYGRTLSR